MTAQYTLLQLRNASKQRADMSGSSTSDQFIPDDEWNSYINASIGEWNELIVSADVKFFLTSSTFTLAVGQNSWPLPSQVINDSGNGPTNCPIDFLVGKGLDFSTDGSGNPGTGVNVLRLENWSQRNRGNNTYWLGIPYAMARYDIVAGNLMFFPPTLAAGTYVFWWYPDAPTLVQDTDWVDNQRYWSEYIIVDAAIKALQKEESDVSVLMAQKQALTSRILQMGGNRDYGTPVTFGAYNCDSGGNGRYGPGGGGW